MSRFPSWRWVSSVLLDEMDVAVAVALLADMYTRQLYYAKNAVERCYPASITKVMTTLATLERGERRGSR